MQKNLQIISDYICKTWYKITYR